MGKKISVVVAVTAGVLAVALGFFSTVQTVRCNEFEKKVQQLELLNKNLASQVESLNSKIDKLEKELKTETEKAEQQAKAQAKTETTESTQTQTKVSAKTENSSSAAKVKTQKIAYLTFDDGPSYNTPDLLDILKENNVKATFFVIASSKDTAQRRAWMKREVDEGHTIGIHSWSHKYSYIYSSESNFLADFTEIKNMIVAATGVEPKFSRFPGGTDNTVSLKINNGAPIMPKLLQDVLDQGITPVDWNAGGMDAVTPVPAKSTIVNGVVNQCKNLKTAIILLHDSSPHSSSVAAVPEIIKQLRAMGFTFKPLTSSDEAIRRSPALKR